jgi:hypothetical protein
MALKSHQLSECDLRGALANQPCCRASISARSRRVPEFLENPIRLPVPVGNLIVAMALLAACRRRRHIVDRAPAAGVVGSGTE